MARSGPPAFAWDWFARQRLLWRTARERLAATGTPVAERYRAVEQRAEALALLRTDYPRDDTVRTVVHEVVAELAFLSRTDRSWQQLGLRSAPRGQRWWWFALTGEDVDTPSATPDAPARQLSLEALTETDLQLALDEVAEGYGDR
ncbi:MAG: hypothetical protein JJT89_09770 [Nitriliruptoraceae bacterium]|nr:hypothetical protein [Nitriliruptoraceae bacterium]